MPTSEITYLFTVKSRCSNAILDGNQHKVRWVIGWQAAYSCEVDPPIPI